MGKQLTWDNKGFYVDGKPAYIMSGEFHYFRVPRQDWAARMRLLREAGGNMLATYVPWLIHEPQEGQFVFGDCPSRDLQAFLETAAQEGLMVLVRPGPYQYSELAYAGLPGWLVQRYPQVLAMDETGEPICRSGPSEAACVSYLHPLFLQKARRYYAAFCDVIRPYLASNGGPVVMTQVDNECSGVHLWNGSFDCNPDTIGLGWEDGRWAMWLRGKYGTVAAMNEAYRASYAAFSEVPPVGRTTPGLNRVIGRDYGDFYASMIAEYLHTLAGWLREERIDTPVCHNSPNPGTNSLFLETTQAMGDRFLLGSDHYYALSPTWPQNNPTPQYAAAVLYSMDLLHAMRMPPMIMELPAGNLSDSPPMLPNDLLAAYMTNAAMGMKGSNYYIFTGGPNIPGTGTTGDIYDYHAPIGAFGEIRESYQSVKAFGAFMQQRGWLQTAMRSTQVQLGFDWKDTRLWDYQPVSEGPDAITGAEAWRRTSFDLLMAMMSGSMPPAVVPISGELDVAKPLVMVCPDRMRHENQQRLAAFVNNGGKLLLMPKPPVQDEYGRADTILADALGISEAAPLSMRGTHARLPGLGHVYGIKDVCTAEVPQAAQPLCFDAQTDTVIGAQWAVGQGQVIWLGFTFEYRHFAHAALMEYLCGRLGAKPVAESSNRNVWTAYWTDGKHKLLYVMNLFSSPQKTEILLHDGEKPVNLGEIALNAMQVRTFEF